MAAPSLGSARAAWLQKSRVTSISTRALLRIYPKANGLLTTVIAFIALHKPRTRTADTPRKDCVVGVESFMSATYPVGVLRWSVVACITYRTCQMLSTNAAAERWSVERPSFPRGRLTAFSSGPERKLRVGVTRTRPFARPSDLDANGIRDEARC